MAMGINIAYDVQGFFSGHYDDLSSNGAVELFLNKLFLGFKTFNHLFLLSQYLFRNNSSV